MKARRKILNMHNPDKTPPTKVGFYFGETTHKVHGTKDWQKVYWNGKIFVQEEWKGIKVTAYAEV